MGLTSLNISLSACSGDVKNGIVLRAAFFAAALLADAWACALKRRLGISCWSKVVFTIIPKRVFVNASASGYCLVDGCILPQLFE